MMVLEEDRSVKTILEEGVTIITSSIVHPIMVQLVQIVVALWVVLLVQEPELRLE